MMVPPPPAAQIQQAQVSHPLSFEGWNRLPLAGVVQPAEGSPWFAVLVADSGPLDADWAAKSRPGHLGRDLAGWLRGQGIGSLRFAKRIARATDPKLDASLDAQAGDIRAALQAARALPEARGRKLLLVGHGEGALLALLAAQETDALLLLALPPEPMAKAIADQVAVQLPAERAAPNKAYLRAVFQAIRDGKPAPAAGAEVYPALARLGASLMAPETLAFVRATLDLDPLAMAARAPVPTAVAWGGKDLLAWRPNELPKGFPAAVLDLPDANHQMRREPLPRAGLTAAAALEGYGDDRPLADLAPVAAWLKALE